MRNWFWLALTAALTLPALYVRLSGVQVTPSAGAIIFGLAIVGAAFLLAWGCEVGQTEVSQALAVAALALIAVLPEYAVDFYFAWMAAQNPEYSHYAVANMTGANRLLIGIGWPAVVFLFWLNCRAKFVAPERTQVIELSALALATIYAFTIPLKGTLSLLDSVVLVTIFAFYIWITSRMKVMEPELAGPPAAVACLPRPLKRALTVFMFLFPGAVILASAKPFAESLILIGKRLAIEEFIMVQWVAPLASETPEMVIVSIFALQGKGALALGALISSKVNQWTLLVGTLPLVYSLSLGSPGALPLDARQSEEILLTAAQSAFAIALLVNLRLGIREAGALFLLFSTQLLFVAPLIRYLYSSVYIVLALFILLTQRRQLKGLLQTAGALFNELRASGKE